MIHYMKLQEEPFISIKEGIKKIEMRLYDEKRKKINVGDTIEFTNIITNEILKVNVIKLYIFNNFDELYSIFDKKLLGYLDDEKASPLDMSKYYKEEDIKKYGVVGIEIVKE